MDVKPAPATAMDVVAPSAAALGGAEPKKRPEEKPSEVKKSPKTKAPKKARNGNVIAAIIATLIIVLGLSAMAVFAYLKQTGSI